jgi:predicted TIM-barrel fold metal-dependent hydrolase
MRGSMLISADSHVVEPGDLWARNLPAELRDQAPRAVQDPDNHHWYLRGPGMARGVDLTLSMCAGMTAAEVNELLARDPAATVGVQGGSDPIARLRDLWRDGTVADVVYPTCGLSIMQLEDSTLQQACCRVYNDWLAQFVAADPDRLVGLAMLPSWDLGAAVEELTRSHGMGLRGAIIWTAPPGDTGFFDESYEPLWSAAEELGMPISFHILSGARSKKGLAAFNTTVRDTFYFTFISRDEVQRSICEMIAAGVFERHPNLRVVAAEAGIEWGATLERTLDNSYRSFWSKLPGAPSLKPSEYFRRNVYLTFIDDPIGLNNLRFTGAEHFMWSSDYPHLAATWPRSQSVIDAEFGRAAVSADDLRRITLTNVAELYGIDLDTVAQPSRHVDAAPAGV